MEKLIDHGYGFSVRVSVVSYFGDQMLTYWGFACPLWWASPSYDMDTIQRRGAFGTGQQVVIAQCNTLHELEESLLEKAQDAFPDPYKFPNADDARRVYPKLYAGQQKAKEGGE